MTDSVKSTLRRALLAVLASVLFLPAAHAQRAERLTEALDLTDAQAALVRDAVSEEAESGDLWALAANLAPTLTDEQKGKLLARPERGDRMERQRGERKRGDRRGRGRAERSTDEDRAERRETMQEKRVESQQAMRDALDLTDAQAQQLGALRAERMAEREARRAQRKDLRDERPAPGELPADLAAILTPEQQEIARVHQALAARLMQHRFQQRSPRR